MGCGRTLRPRALHPDPLVGGIQMSAPSGCAPTVTARCPAAAPASATSCACPQAPCQVARQGDGAPSPSEPAPPPPPPPLLPPSPSVSGSVERSSHIATPPAESVTRRPLPSADHERTARGGNGARNKTQQWELEFLSGVRTDLMITARLPISCGAAGDDGYASGEAPRTADGGVMRRPQRWSPLPLCTRSASDAVRCGWDQHHNGGPGSGSKPPCGAVEGAAVGPSKEEPEAADKIEHCPTGFCPGGSRRSEQH